ncbi:glutamine--tRNA ligase/YqeY domain fusion protein [Desulfobotulus mexicanus]|uniref:Glutamine--tRNA ligase n=1 Tax=Desulfobotulus mexicanus TaxID=2586642 RepID=A0A5Q4VFK5_9BACT|nr:glutamine--tRNA ligase/YqeY domain fusion protein [Desulfobotulus mexicanus]TYT74940.1 glutamine--tRNA ligase/YqeY domain fusion protein [Desulfobotulus mexicanus]
MSTVENAAPSHFIRNIIKADLEADTHKGRVHTRFPPEPNGYLHMGHAKSICLNFGMAGEFSGKCNLRFDDTNPEKESLEYVNAIKEDVRWLGFDWEDREFYASDYFEKLYSFAVELIRGGKAYVCSLSAEETRSYRGTLTEAGKNSPYRDRSVEENLDLFARMRAGEFDEGSHVLRLKIDMASPNFLMRDPTIYRIRKVHHHRTGDAWCIYPMYDFTHCISDALEGITHSICTLEFENNREIYDWVLDNIDAPARPKQYEFARLNLSYTVLSKRKLIQLVKEGHVHGWDDPRMPTLSGLRRRGVPAAALRDFCERIGVAKKDSTVDLALFEYCVRDHLNASAPRRMGVLDPVKLVITNYPEGQVELLDAVNHPGDPAFGSRKVPFSRELWIEREDFMEDPPKKFFRLSPGREVRLRFAYFVTCEDIVKDPETGEVLEIRAVYDPETLGGNAPDGRKVKATIHWVSKNHAMEAEARLYDRLFTKEDPDDMPEGKSFLDALNPDSFVQKKAFLEPAMAESLPGEVFQLERVGYFAVDPESQRERPVLNRTVTLRDSWAKAAGKS